MKRIGNSIFACSLLALALTSSFTLADENMVPQTEATKTLAALGSEWLDANPYAGQTEAVRVGAAEFGENCARCHGLEAKSGGIAPDLRLLDRDCLDLSNNAKKQACYKETDKYFMVSIRHGKVRNGNVYMPPFEGLLSQETMWSIKTYLESLRGTFQ
jgi:cytochrome c-550 PedF